MTAGLTDGRQTQCRRNEVECRSVQERHEVSEQYRDRRKGVNTINRSGQNQNPSAEEDRTRWMATSVKLVGIEMRSKKKPKGLTDVVLIRRVRW